MKRIQRTKHLNNIVSGRFQFPNSIPRMGSDLSCKAFHLAPAIRPHRSHVAGRLWRGLRDGRRRSGLTRHARRRFLTIHHTGGVGGGGGGCWEGAMVAAVQPLGQTPTKGCALGLMCRTG